MVRVAIVADPAFVPAGVSPRLLPGAAGGGGNIDHLVDAFIDQIGVAAVLAPFVGDTIRLADGGHDNEPRFQAPENRRVGVIYRQFEMFDENRARGKLPFFLGVK